MSNTDTTHAAATPRTIPWDCSDWQASAAVDDAENARVSVILESLATNRGKTLYCAVDQSDTFTKAETWQAGRDRNERDDTVYYGENGRFRGFLSAQEGYLTDGESGVTGISRERIFEFPEEPKKKRRWRIKRLEVGPFTMYTAWGPTPTTGQNNPTSGRADGRLHYSNNPPPDDDAYWQSEAQRIATNYCTHPDRGYQRARDARPTLAASAAPWHDEEHYRSQGFSRQHWHSRKTNTWTATCYSRVRR